MFFDHSKQNIKDRVWKNTVQTSHMYACTIAFGTRMGPYSLEEVEQVTFAKSASHYSNYVSLKWIAVSQQSVAGLIRLRDTK